ncbi:transposase [Mucilaginibacter gracilis]|uniref:Transposase n=1 Tax=Mucilaginibacter gracilis TaxID=423350 RepID=A0A495J101_9SPHI|nr:IS110 family transposase [Mucilaginibacter gracilis]RKR81984.1 transposase [Mucilaginibacter gracilis]
MAIDKPKKYSYFIGIDVSRNELDFAVQQGGIYLYHKEIGNQAASITELVNEFKNLPKFIMSRAVFCMESTGIYCNIVIAVLKKFKANIVQESPLHIRNSLGNIRGKNDKVDAMRIAAYAYRHRDELRLWVPKRKVVQQLADLSALRVRLMTTQVALKNPLLEQKDFLKKGAASETYNLCKRSLTSIALDIDSLEKHISALIAEDEHLKRLFDIVTSVTCIGLITALQMIIHTNEFKDISTAKKFACYAGVAPFKNESGGFLQRARVSHIANKRMKSLLHICAVGALRYDKDIKIYYERKIAEGKPKMSVINAVRVKLINRVFTCVHQNRLYQKDYKSVDV